MSLNNKDKRERELIRAMRMVDFLTKHVEGTHPMEATQVQAARIIIGKVIPDLKAIEHSGTTTLDIKTIVIKSE
jgi:hypothetical protein